MKRILKTAIRLLKRLERDRRHGLEAVAHQLYITHQHQEALELYQVLSRRFPLSPRIHSTLRMLKETCSNGNNRQVDYLVIGAQKAGTTALHYYLRQHEEICTPRYMKEVHYFDRSGISTNYSNYHQLFFPDENHKVLGETTPVYLFYPGVMEQIRLYNPEMKIIILLRDPIDRLYSQWNMDRKPDDEFDAAAAIEDYENADPFSYYNLIARSMYYPQLRRVYDNFPAGQIRIYRNEDLRDSHMDVLNDIAHFLGISRITDIEGAVRHKRTYSREITPADYSRLKPLFKDDLAEVQSGFGVDTSGWLTKF